MKVETILITWHSRDPIFSIDFHPLGGKIATGGADSCVNVSLNFYNQCNLIFNINFFVVRYGK